MFIDLIKRFFSRCVWHVTAEYRQTAVGRQLTSFDDVYQWQGEFITKSPLCQVYKIKIEDCAYYLKRYGRHRKAIARYFGISKVRAEWQNLIFFRNIGVPTAKVVAYGEERLVLGSQRGILITEELSGTMDLLQLANEQSPLLEDRLWVARVSHQLAVATRNLHQHNFAHNDLKWRNILIDIQSSFPHVYLIDCPSGMKWPWPFLQYRIIKDLACLDKVAKYQLSRTQRLAFYKDYCECKKLSPWHKRQIHKIIIFFHNRE